MRHTFRSFVVAAVAAQLVLTTVAAAQSLASGTRRYRIDATTVQDVDAEAVGGGRQKSTLDRSAFLMITLTDSAGGKAMRVVIDSLVSRGDDQPPGSAATADSARGKSISGFLAADGTAAPFSFAADIGSLGVALGAQLDEFFPKAKSSTKTGDRWTVTSDRPVLIPNGELTIKRSTTYEAKGSQMRDGASAERLELSFSTTSVGQQRLGPVMSKVDGSSTGHGSAFLTSAGVYLGGVRNEKTERRLMLDGAPAPVLVMAESVNVITLLK